MLCEVLVGWWRDEMGWLCEGGGRYLNLDVSVIKDVERWRGVLDI